jgi:L-threonylcarbamoyladenylate synthase
VLGVPQTESDGWTLDLTRQTQRIADAAAAIRRGELVAFPTETVYGLGACAFDAAAVAKIFEYKGRPRFDPLIVHLADPTDWNEVVAAVPDQAAELMKQFWPGPLSLVLPRLPRVPDIVTAGLASVAIRCPDHALARQLIRAAGVPLAAPSANRFGRVSPTTADHVAEQFGDRVPLVLDDGPCRIGLESTVVSFVDSADSRPTLLRHGGVTMEQLQAVLGTIDERTHDQSRPSSPGQLSRHYSPATPLRLTNQQHDWPEVAESRRIGLLSFRSPPATATSKFAAVEVLSETGDLREAAVNLFAAMRRLDALGLDLIIARPVPEIDLGRAIMDRLRRAAAQ